MILEGYAAAINARDPEQMASLFAPECYFSAGGGRSQGAPDVVCRTRHEVLEHFTRTMANHEMRAEVLRVNPASMEYDIVIGSSHVNPCIGTVTVDGDGLIAELIVRPR